MMKRVLISILLIIILFINGCVIDDAGNRIDVSDKDDVADIKSNQQVILSQLDVISLKLGRGENLIKYGSFETDDSLSAWAESGALLSSSDTVGSVLGNKTGLVLANGSWSNVAQSVNNYSDYLGKTLRISCWYYIPSLSTSTVTVSLYNGSVPDYFWDCPPGNHDDNWHYLLTSSFVFSSSATQMTLRLHSSYSASANYTATAYFDDVWLWVVQ